MLGPKVGLLGRTESNVFRQKLDFFSPSKLEAEAGGSKIWASLSYIVRPSLIKTRQSTDNKTLSVLWIDDTQTLSYVRKKKMDSWWAGVVEQR